MKRVRRSPRAVDDLDEIWRFVAADNLQAADRLIDRLIAAGEPLAEFPHLGRDRTGLAPGLRSLPVGNYVLFYRPDGHGAVIVRILHGRRDITPDLFA